MHLFKSAYDLRNIYIMLLDRMLSERTKFRFFQVYVLRLQSCLVKILLLRNKSTQHKKLFAKKHLYVGNYQMVLSWSKLMVETGDHERKQKS